MKKAIYLIILLAGFFFISCQTNQNQKFDKAEVTKKLIEGNKLYLQAVIKADFNAMRELEKCDPDSVIDISDGTINWQKKFKNRSDEELKSAFSFDKIKYTEIKNLQEPVFNFSPDGMMAYEYGKEQFTYETKDSLGITKKNSFIIAYLAVWEKRDTCWATVAGSQTFNYNSDK
jgi:hypothetical protein